jgi:bifunctional enzyme CysN/CysC
MVVAVNKMDLVDYSEEVFDRICRDYTAFSTRLQIPDTTFIPISALKGDNVVEPSSNMPWYKGSPLLHHLETVHIASDTNLIDLRFPIQYVLRPDQGFRGYSGSVASGVIRKGDDIVCLPSRQRTRVQAIVTYDGELNEAFPPQAVTVVLEDNVDLSRGDMLVHPHNLPNAGNRVEAMLVWMDEQPGVAGADYLLKQTTNTVPAVLSQVLYTIDVNTLRRQQSRRFGLNEIGRATLELKRPLLWDSYNQNRATGSLILIDRLTNRTVAAGMIVNRKPAESGVDRLVTRPVPPPGDGAPGCGATSSKKGAVIWLTGLSGSGKSTIANEVVSRLAKAGRHAYVLDGDDLRTGLCADLGFSPEDRAENIRRAGEVAALFADAGIIVVTAFISPYAADRDRVRRRVPEGRFLEVHLDVPVEACEARDPKGLYGKARAGLLRGFTGIDAPYEAPEAPDLALATHRLSVEECADRVEVLLRARGIIRPEAG